MVLSIMLSLVDRLEVALNNRMGIQLSPEETVALAGVLVYLRKKKVVGVLAKLKALFGEGV